MKMCAREIIVKQSYITASQFQYFSHHTPGLS